ncbi:jg24662, partial [Pararge aegeria aegeria]
DKIYPVHKFLLQRNIRVQYLIIVKKSLWCNTISLKFQKAMSNLGYNGQFDSAVSLCVRDVSLNSPLSLPQSCKRCHERSFSQTRDNAMSKEVTL